MKKFTVCALLLMSGTVLSANIMRVQHQAKGMFSKTAALRRAHTGIGQESPEFRERAEQACSTSSATSKFTPAGIQFIIEGHVCANQIEPLFPETAKFIRQALDNIEKDPKTLRFCFESLPKEAFEIAKDEARRKGMAIPTYTNATSSAA